MASWGSVVRVAIVFFLIWWVRLLATLGFRRWRRRRGRRGRICGRGR